MSGSLRLNGSTSGFSEITAPDVAGDQTFTLPAVGGILNTGPIGIVQVVNKLNSTGAVTDSQTFVDAKNDAIITTKSASNKVLVIVNHALSPISGNTSGFALLRLLRGTTTILQDDRCNLSLQYDHQMYSYTVLDSPNYFGEIRYSMQQAVSNSAFSVESQHSNLRTSCVTLIELSGL